jgi:hypothetical protein
MALADGGYFSEAIVELRIAESNGERDDLIAHRLGDLLERTNKKSDSIVEFKRFLLSRTCQEIDYRCEDARQRIEDAASTK